MPSNVLMTSRIEIQAQLQCSLTLDRSDTTLLEELRSLFRAVEDRDFRVSNVWVSQSLFAALRRWPDHFSPSEEGKGTLWGAAIAVPQERSERWQSDLEVSVISYSTEHIQVFGRGLPLPPPLTSVWERLDDDA